MTMRSLDSPAVPTRSGRRLQRGGAGQLNVCAYAWVVLARLLSVFVLFAFMAAASAAGSGSGIRGRVVASPTCPVETVPPDPRCAPRAFAALLRVYRRSDHRVVARVRTGDDGRFEVRLRPGRYAVSARPLAGGPLPRCPQEVKATVRAGLYTHVAIDCDSGIR
jgi:hypothetical protein